ncbi:MAG: endonuclease/exonuclease/phosphatase family protein [Clostridiales bacterium]
MKTFSFSWFFTIFMFIPCLALFPQKAAKDNPLRVMTYNIRYAGTVASDSAFAWENRKEQVASMVRFNRADIAGMQEVLKLQLDDLKKMLPEFDALGLGRDDGKESGEYSAIFYRKNRLSVLKSATFWLSETPGKVSKGWDAACNRVVTWAKFKDKMTGKVFFHFNTHFDHIGEAARNNSAFLLLNKVKEIAGNFPVIVTGDFNFTADSKYYKILTESKANPELEVLKDAQNISLYPHYGGHVSFNDFGRNTDPNNKIDYIFVKNQVKVINHGIIGEKLNGRYPSDHMPVVADIIP